MNRIYKNDLQHICDVVNTCAEFYSSPIQTISIILNPVKCAYSADYHTVGDNLVICAGVFNRESIIHEFLHHIIHRHIEEYRKKVICHKSYPFLDSSYYLDNDVNGKLNAFEEYVVRRFTEKVHRADFPPNLDMFIDSISNELS